MKLHNIKINEFSTIKDAVFSKDDILDYINSLVSFLEVTDYLEKVTFTNIRYQDLASYNFKYRELKVSLIAIINEVRMELNYHKEYDYTLYANLLILSSIIHEIIHVVQNHLITESNLPIASIFSRELELFGSDNEYLIKYYQQHYSSFIFEREANICSTENILRIIVDYCYDEHIYKHYFELLKSELLSGYEKSILSVYSPIERIYDDLIKLKTPEIDNISLYDRIKLGFQVSKDDYDEFASNVDNIILSKNNLLKL